MGKYLDWYLVEAEAALRNRVPQAQLHDILAETEAHLSDGATEYATHGMGLDESEIAAIERFGRVGKFAERFVEGTRGQVASRALMVVTFLGCIAAATSPYIGPRPAGPEGAARLNIAVLIGILAVVAATPFVRRQRIGQVAVVGLAGALLGSLVVWPIATRWAYVTRVNERLSAQRWIGPLDEQVNWAKRGLAGFSANDRKVEEDFKTGAQYDVPDPAVRYMSMLAIGTRSITWDLSSMPYGKELGSSQIPPPEGVTPIPRGSLRMYLEAPTNSDSAADRRLQHKVPGAYLQANDLAAAKASWAKDGPLLISQLEAYRNQIGLAADADPRLGINGNFATVGLRTALAMLVGAALYGLFLAVVHGLTLVALGPFRRTWLRRRLA